MGSQIKHRTINYIDRLTPKVKVFENNDINDFQLIYKPANKILTV